MKKKHQEKISLDLEVELKGQELEDYSKELASLLIEKRQLEAQRSRLTKDIKPINERIEEIAPLVYSGKEKRPVTCTWHYDWTAGSRKLTRSDTFEVLDEGPIPEGKEQPLDLE